MAPRQRDRARQTHSRGWSTQEPQRRCGAVEFRSMVCLRSGWSLWFQMNTLGIGEPQNQSPAVEVVGDCDRDLIIARFQRQREGAVFQRTTSVGELSRGFNLPEIFAGIYQLTVDEEPHFARPSNVHVLGLLGV